MRVGPSTPTVPANSPSTWYGASTIAQSRSSSISFSEPMLTLTPWSNKLRTSDTTTTWCSSSSSRCAALSAVANDSCSAARRLVPPTYNISTGRASTSSPNAPRTARASRSMPSSPLGRGSGISLNAHPFHCPSRAAAAAATCDSSRTSGNSSVYFSTAPFDSTATASTTPGWSVTSWTPRTWATSGCGPTTIAVWSVTRDSSWLVSWSRSSNARCADSKNSATARRCATRSAPSLVKWSTK